MFEPLRSEKILTLKLTDEISFSVLAQHSHRVHVKPNPTVCVQQPSEERD